MYIFASSDIAIVPHTLHESIPFTGSIASGTYSYSNPCAGVYAVPEIDNNIQNPTSGMYQSVYDYPFLSSSANHAFDIGMGFSPNSWASASVPTDSANPQQAKKINHYNYQAIQLAGFNANGTIKEFRTGGDDNGAPMRELFTVNFARLLVKDEIQKASFSCTVLTGGVSTTCSPTHPLLLQDLGADTNFRVNSPAGEYGLLYTSSAAQTAGAAHSNGMIYYQAGIMVLSASVFDFPSGSNAAPGYFGEGASVNPRFDNINDALTGSWITASCNGFRNRLNNVSFNNTTFLNSTVYNCRLGSRNLMSSNPTWYSSSFGASQIYVKDTDPNAPATTYITSIGLYNSANELMAVAKISPPIQKQENEVLLKVMLNF